MANNIDDAALWWESRQDELQEYSIPEPPAEAPGFVNLELEEETEKKEHLTDRDLKTELNLNKLNEPTAEVIVSLLDIVLPLTLTLLIKSADKESLKLDNNEHETLVNAFSQYLKTQSVVMSPGVILLVSLATIYGAKITVCMSENKTRQDEVAQIKEQNELLRRHFENQQINIEQNEKKS